MTALGSVASSAIALSTEYAAMELAAMPTHLKGGLVNIALTTVAGAASVTWYLSADAAGDVPVTPVRTADAIVGRTAGKGGVACSLDSVPIATWLTPGTLWVQAKLDVGTASGIARLAWGG